MTTPRYKEIYDINATSPSGARSSIRTKSYDNAVQNVKYWQELGYENIRLYTLGANTGQILNINHIN